MKTSSAKPEAYDILVLGSGEAGKYIAWTLAKQGRRVAVIERKYIGGSCPNIACLPSKNIIHSAKVANRIFSAAGNSASARTIAGLTWRRSGSANAKWWPALLTCTSPISNPAARNCSWARDVLPAPKTIELTQADGTKRLLQGGKIVLCVGTHATIDSVPGLAEANPLTHIEALELDHIPEHLLVLGGGYIGLEFAQAMRRFGSRVTVIERNASLIHREDDDVTAAIHELFRDEGIEVLTDSRIAKVEGKSGETVKVYVTQSGSEKIVTGSHLLVASGRTPNTKGIGLELAGVELTDRGYIKVNDRLETTAPDVFAVGECAGSPQFTHIAFDDFRIVRDNLAGGNRVTTGRQTPYCLFTDPELARIGLSETEAKKNNIAYRLAKIPMMAALRTRTLSETRGFMKALIDTKSDRILGFTAFGVEAGEIMASVQVAMLAGLPYTALRDTIFTHPTLAEGLVALFYRRAARFQIVRLIFLIPLKILL